jgi:hypothetical protein
VRSIEDQVLQEYAALLPDVDLTEMGLVVRGLVASDPENERVQSLNDVIDLMVKQVWDRFQGQPTSWPTKRQHATVHQVTLAMLTETLQAHSDSELKEYARVTRDEILRSADHTAVSRLRVNLSVSVSIMMSRAATQRMLSCLGTENYPKGKPWNGEDG